MSKEATARILRPEFRRPQSITTEVFFEVDFSSGPSRGVTRRNEIVRIGGSFVPRLEIVHAVQETPSNITEFPKIKPTEISPIEEIKEAVYNPGKKIQELYKEDRRRFRIRRRSRCDGVHDAQEKPCGSPRCRTKNRVNLEKKQTAGKEKAVIVRSKGRKNRMLVFGK